ncbi:DUF2726 domain-containing protein [Rhizobium sp. TH2]|uniref:DUF2726 domain-containing protein n=1 Tax=Rhizobium sp. TH2 TaxID=2775403 RepID=UPI0021577485|nr:DUF2726 domain-containing protein [Rhizobium sp. TH2]UVC10377.1 DUF2726 domain-containing protein [Rhizobium sp. TH2]
MSPEITLIAALFIGLVVGVAISRLRSSLRRREWRARDRAYSQSRPHVIPNVEPGPWLRESEVSSRPTDAADQLRIVMAASFSAQPLLSKSEVRVYQDLDAFVTACNPRWLVMAQVSLGEILKSRDAQAYSCINSKRVDLLLVDENCHPRHVVEYQGSGHHQGTAAARDAVKKEALRRAGIGYHEVVAGHTTPSELKRLVERLVESPASTQSTTTRTSTN